MRCCIILGGALLEIIGDDPVVGVNPLDDTGAPQGFQPAHMRLDIAIVIVIRAREPFASRR